MSDALARFHLGLAPLDQAILIAYFAATIGIGVWAHRAAKRDLDAYFLGGRRLPWWMLGVSGTACYFDVAGVMWGIGLFYFMGVKMMWLQWEWGFLMTAFLAAFMGKWLRRSRVMTGAEWMRFRFGAGPAGRAARLAYAVLAVTVAAAFIAQATVGIGKFGHVFFPHISREWCALAIIGATTIYVVAGGLVSVVITDFLQFCLLAAAAFILSGYGFALSDGPGLRQAMDAECFRFLPPWRWPALEGNELYPGYELFALCALVWVLKGMFLSFGGPQQLYDTQRFLAARNARSASTLGMIWGVALMPMFMLYAGVAVLGVAVPAYREVARQDPEHLYALVVGHLLPAGVKGFVFVGIAAAFMSTFSATVNGGASYLVRDLYQGFLRPKASQRALVRAGYIASVLLVAAGVAVGLRMRGVDQVFGWIMMVLGTGVAVPNLLKWYWWRMNGWGYAAATLAGVGCALLQAQFLPHARIWETFFPSIALTGTIAVAVSLATPPDRDGVLDAFYRRIQPPGLWGPVRGRVRASGARLRAEPFRRDLLNACLGATALHAYYMAFISIIIHDALRSALCAAGAAVLSVVLYFTWYRRLPEDVPEEGPAPP